MVCLATVRGGYQAGARQGVNYCIQALLEYAEDRHRAASEVLASCHPSAPNMSFKLQCFLRLYIEVFWWAVQCRPRKELPAHTRNRDHVVTRCYIELRLSSVADNSCVARSALTTSPVRLQVLKALPPMPSTGGNVISTPQAGNAWQVCVCVLMQGKFGMLRLLRLETAGAENVGWKSGYTFRNSQ